MIKYAFALTIICALAGCDQPPAKNNIIVANTDQTPASGAKHLSTDLMIDPGTGIGKIKIGSSTDSVIKTLGEPDAGDAAMGASLMTWYANHNSGSYHTSVYAHHSYNDKDEGLAKVKAIRVTSPDFNTAEMVHVGMPLDSIAAHYNLRSQSQNGNGTYKVYDDNQEGIAFEIDRQEKCSAIIVFEEGGSSVAYLNLQQ